MSKKVFEDDHSRVTDDEKKVLRPFSPDNTDSKALSVANYEVLSRGLDGNQEQSQQRGMSV